MTITTDRERQRFEHLVLGRARPALAVMPAKPAGMGKAEWKIVKQRLRDAGTRLSPGIEERVQLRERWSHKAVGTAETHDHADREQRRPGSLARLYTSGAIDADQLAAADEIASAYRAIVAGVAIKTASFEARIDGGSHGRAEGQALGLIYADFAYDWWREAVGACAEPLLAVIVHDGSLTIVARRYGLSMPRARRMLTDALDLWWMGRGRTKGAARAAVGAD